MALIAHEYIPLKPLVAIIGDEASKQTLTAYLKHQFVPSLKIISCLDSSEFAACLAPPTDDREKISVQGQQSRKGILRADWLEKHQSRRPAVALVLVPRHHATGDPSSWATLASNLDSLRALTKPTKIRVVIAVVQPPGDASPLPDDRIAMLARHSGADRNCVILYEANNDAAMRSLGVLLQAQAAVFYSTNAQTRLNSYSQNGLASVDANLRAAFKLGALAELRGDWPGAVQLYKEAYGYVGQVSMAGAAPLQRFLEVRTVAEVVHHRLLALLLGALRDHQAAALQLTNHLDMLHTVPNFNAPVSLLANHAGWVAQQYTTAAELVLSSGLLAASVASNVRPTQLYIEAYHAASTRRRTIQELTETRGGGGAFVGLSNKEESVNSGRYLGQIEIFNSANPSDEQVETWLEMEELEYLENTSSYSSSKYSCLGLLQAAKRAVASASPQSSSSTLSTSTSSSKLLAHINTLLGEELLYYCGDIPAAKRVLLDAAEQYRTDRWNGPLFRVLMALRECIGKEKESGNSTSAGTAAEHVTLCLEASAVAPVSTKEDIVSMAHAAVEELASKSLETEVVVEAAAAPWATILKITSAGFLNKKPEDEDDGADRVFKVTLQNRTPVDLPFLSGSVLFEESHRSFEVPLQPLTEATTPKIAAGCFLALKCSVRLPSGRKASPWIAASQLKIQLTSNSLIAYVLPAAMATAPSALPLPNLRIEVAAKEIAPEIALLLPEKGFLGEYLPAKIKISTPNNKSNFKIGNASQRCRVVVSATVAGKAAAILVDTMKSNKVDSQLQNQLKFELESPNINEIEINFGFCVQAAIEDSILFSAQLHYTLGENNNPVGEEDANEEDGELSMVEVTAAVPVVLPFECDVHIAPMVATTPTLLSTKNSTTNGKSCTIMAGPVYTSTKTSTSPLLEDVLAASLGSLSVSDAQLRRTLAPRLPPHFTLPSSNTGGKEQQGKSCASVSVRKVKPKGQEWRNDASMEALNITKLSLGENRGGTAATAMEFQITPFNENEKDVVSHLTELSTPGDTCCAAFQLTTTQQGATHNNTSSSTASVLPSLANLLINWRRSSPIPLRAHYASSSNKLEEETTYFGSVEGLQDGTLTIPLPPVMFTSTTITAQPRYPPTATAGEPISLEIEIGLANNDVNMSLSSQEVEVVVGEPHGFLIAGPRATTVVLGGESDSGDSRSTSTNSRVSLCLVPYHVGYLELPEIKVSMSGNKELQATQGCVVYVKPAAVDGGAENLSSE